MARIFISHSHVDEAEAIALSDWLISQGWGGEDDIFLDLDPKRGLVGGERWQEALKRNVRRCEAIVFLITPAWCKSDWCRAEFLFAKNLNKPIFGIIAKPIELSDVPIEMTAEWQLVDLTREGAQEDFSVKAVSDGKAHNLSFNASELTRLKAGLENTGIDPSYFAWPPEDEPNRAPYQGLRAMQSQDAGIFFGRDGQILEGLDRLRGLHDAPPPRMLVILGASGAGKSSYMRAGLLPRLKRDDRHFVVLDSIRPGGNVLSGETGFVAALKHTLEAHDIAASPRRIKQAIGETLDEGSETSSLHDLLHQLASSHVDGQVEIEADENNKSALPSIVIPIDQAEELYFNQDESGASEAKQFRQLLSILARDERLNIILLLTIRSDSYQHMQLDTVLGGVEHQTLSLPPIAQGSYSQIILGPVQRLTMNSDRKLAIEEKLVERLLHDIAQGGAKDALPLLAFTLERLYSEYLEGDTLTLQDYEQMGGIRGSIEAAVEQAFKTADQRGDANIPMEKQARLALLKRGLIPYLASVDPEHNGAVRRVAPLSSIPQEARPIMELLVEQRLLATDTRPELDDKNEPTGKLETTIEPAHEALLRQWGQLGEWLEEDREALSALDGVKRAVIEWDANDKGDAFLAHTAGRLESAEQVTNDERFHDYLNQRDRNYLAACRKADNERRNQALEQEKKIFELKQQKKINRRTRLGLIVASVLAIFAGGIGFYAFQQKQIAEEQTHFAEIQKMALADSLERVNLNQSKFLRSTALSAMSEENYDEARGLMKEAWDKIGGIYNPENSWNNHLTAAQRRLEYNDPLKMILSAHKKSVKYAQFSPDGSSIVTVSNDKTSRIWNTMTGVEIAILGRHTDQVNSAQFSSDGQRVVTASDDKTARVWDVETRKEYTLLKGHESAVNSAQFSADGNKIVTASYDGTARIWNTRTGEELTILRGHEKGVTHADFNFNGKLIITSSRDKTARLWDVKTGNEIMALVGHDDIVMDAQFSPEGKIIVTASADGTARLWDTKTGDEIAVLEGHGNVVSSAQFSSNGESIVTASYDKTARLWHTKTGSEIAVYEGHEDWLYSAQVSIDGKSIVTASRDKTARIWSTKIENKFKIFFGQENTIIAAKFSLDGKNIVITANDGSARIWDTETGKNISALHGHDDGMVSAEFSPNGKLTVTVSDDGTARVWNIKTGEPIAILQGHEGAVNSAEFSTDGMMIVTASDDNTARVWSTITAEPIAILQGHEGAVNSAEFSTDGTMIVTASDDNTARFWSVRTGEEISILSGHDNSIYTAQFNPDGTTVATASADGTVQLRNVQTGKTITRLNKTISSISGDVSLQFSENGKTLLTFGIANKVLLWDTKTGEEIYAFDLGDLEIPKWASFITTTSDNLNERIITLTHSGLIRTWNFPKFKRSYSTELNAARQMILLSQEALDRHFLSEEESKNDEQNLNPCDAAGGSPYDPKRIGPVLEASTMMEENFNSEALINACEQALEDHPNVQRYRFQLARIFHQVSIKLKDNMRMQELFLEASQNGYAAASQWAAFNYSDGILDVVVRDPARALALFKLARSQGMVIANSGIAWAYWDGVGTSQDKPKAILIWQEGAKKGDPFSHHKLAMFYDRGELEDGNTLIKQDLNKAFYHYSIATRLFENVGDKTSAQATRYRRASLARILPQDDVIRIWRDVKAWQPERL